MHLCTAGQLFPCELLVIGEHALRARRAGHLHLSGQSKGHCARGNHTYPRALPAAASSFRCRSRPDRSSARSVYTPLFTSTTHRCNSPKWTSSGNRTNSSGARGARRRVSGRRGGTPPRPPPSEGCDLAPSERRPQMGRRGRDLVPKAGTSTGCRAAVTFRRVRHANLRANSIVRQISSRSIRAAPSRVDYPVEHGSPGSFTAAHPDTVEAVSSATTSCTSPPAARTRR